MISARLKRDNPALQELEKLQKETLIKLVDMHRAARALRLGSLCLPYLTRRT